MNKLSYQHELLINNLTQIFGEFNTEMLEQIEPQMQWIEVLSGQTLFKQNDEGDSLYFVISGRLKAVIESEDGQQKVIGEIIRGETVGEMAIFTDEKRSASIIAIRDSTLVRLSKEVFKQVIQAYPLISLNVTKIIINRLKQSQNPRQVIKKPVNICLLPITEDIDKQGFISNLFEAISPKTNILWLDSQRANSLYGSPNIAQTDKNDSENYRKLSHWLEQQENKYQIIIYVADAQPSQWTQRCVRQSDELFLIADASKSPIVGVSENELLGTKHLTGAKQTLLLLHDQHVQSPRHTDVWLKNRPTVTSHYHIRPQLLPDIARLGRILCGTANGLVLAGGGAKGFAHLGVFKALQEFEIPIDFLGGTSAGALMAMILSFGISPEKAKEVAKIGAAINPSKDYNFFPLVSLLKGKKLRESIKSSIEAITHPDISIEDTWLPLFIVSCNYSKAHEQVHTRGKLLKFATASGSIPGVFPPVIDNGDLLVDGGTFNNFPTDIMNTMNVGKVIGIDLTADKVHNLNLDFIPNPWELLKDKFRTKRNRKYRLPSLVSIMLNTTVLYSTARHSITRQCTDLCFNPDVKKFGILQIKSFEKIYEAGYQHAISVLSAMSDEELAKFRG